MQILTYTEAADFLKSSPGSLRQKVMKREIPFIKFGKSVRFDQQEIEDWVESKKIPAGGKR